MSTVTARHLSPEDLQRFGAEIDALRASTTADLGERDARYIRKVLYTVRTTELIGRGLLMFGWFPPTFLLGAFILGMSKII